MDRRFPTQIAVEDRRHRAVGVELHQDTVRGEQERRKRLLRLFRLLNDPVASAERTFVGVLRRLIYGTEVSDADDPDSCGRCAVRAYLDRMLIDCHLIRSDFCVKKEWDSETGKVIPRSRLDALEQETFDLENACQNPVSIPNVG